MSRSLEATMVITETTSSPLRRKARLLALATVGWNVLEALVAISAGVAARSVALVGFGVDSVIEVTASLSVLWLLAGRHDERRERLTSRAIAVSFAALALYVAVEALSALVNDDRPHHSTVGIVLAAASLAVMPGLALAKRATGRAMGSGAITADGTQTLLCSGSVALSAPLAGQGWRDEAQPVLPAEPDRVGVVRRVPVSAGNDPARGSLVPAVRAVLPRPRGASRRARNRGVDHVTLYRWVQRFTPLMVEAARPCRHAVGDRWFVDETYVKVAGTWRYVYRAVDQHGQVIDVYLSRSVT